MSVATNHFASKLFLCTGVLWCAMTTGCDSSLVESAGQERMAGQDAGPAAFEPIDVLDGRRMPFLCETPADCDDGDNCTREICQQGFCRFATDNLRLTTKIIATQKPSIDVSLGNGMLWIAEAEKRVEAYDLTDFRAPRQLGLYATENEILAIQYTDRGVVFSEGTFGVEIYSPSEFERLALIAPDQGGLRGLDRALSVDVGPRYTIVSGFSDGVVLGDFSDMSNPSAVDLINTPGRSADAAASNEFAAVVADGLGGAQVLAFDTAEGPIVLGGSVETQGRVLDVGMQGDTAVMAEYGMGFGVADLSDPLFPKRLALYPTAAPAVVASLIGPQTSVVGLKNGAILFFALNIAFNGKLVENDLGVEMPSTKPLIPKQIASFAAPTPPVKMDVDNGIVAIALGDGGVVLIDTGCVDK